MQFLNLHTHEARNQSNVLEVINQYPDTFDATVPYYSIGIHPWRIQKDRVEADFSIIAEKSRNASCLAIGECGLDKKIEIPLEVQLPIFERQLRLAQELGKPVIIHCVAAYQEVIETKKRLKIEVPMIIHGFSKKEQVARSLLDNGFYLSFGKWLLRNPDLKQSFLSVPDDRFFLETDTAGEGIEQVYEVAARYKNIGLERLQEITTANFKHVFGQNPLV